MPPSVAHHRQGRRRTTRWPSTSSSCSGRRASANQNCRARSRRSSTTNSTKSTSTHHPADGIDEHKLRREWDEFWLNGRPCALHPPAIRQMDRIWAVEDGKRAVRAGPRCARRGVRRPRLLGSSRCNHRNRAFEFLVAGRDAGSGRGRAQGARRVQVRGRRRGDERVVRDFAAARGSRRRVLRGLRHRHRRSCRPSGAARRAAVGMRFGGRGAAVARERGVDRRAARVMTFLPRSPSDGRHRTARCRRL